MAATARTALLHDIATHGWETIVNDEVVEEKDDMFDEDTEEWGPVEEVVQIGHSPITLFFKIMPKVFWRKVAKETNRYEMQTRSARILEHSEMYGEEQHEKFLAQVNTFQPFHAKDIVHYVSLLIYHASNPQNDMKSHWKTAKSCVGLESPGTFGKVMSRNRFMELSRYVVQSCTILHTNLYRFLHFTNNMDPKAKEKKQKTSAEFEESSEWESDFSYDEEKTNSNRVYIEM